MAASQANDSKIRGSVIVYTTSVPLHQGPCWGPTPSCVGHLGAEGHTFPEGTACAGLCGSGGRQISLDPDVRTQGESADAVLLSRQRLIHAAVAFLVDFKWDEYGQVGSTGAVG